MTCFLWSQKTKLDLWDGGRFQEGPVSVLNKKKVFKEQVEDTTMTHSEEDPTTWRGTWKRGTSQALVSWSWV